MEDRRLDIKREYARIPRTITIKELKNTVEVSAICSEMDEPISIIRNEYEALVIISVEGNKKRHAELWSVNE